ncbi:hypothetical protein ACH50P_22310 [Sulfitobacter sp. M22386]
MKTLTLAASAFAVLAFSPAVQAASASYGASGHYDVAAPQVTLAKHDKHDDKKHQKQHKKAVKEYKKGIRPVEARFQAISACQFHGMSSSMRLIL